MITPTATAVIFILFMKPRVCWRVSGHSPSIVRPPTHGTGDARAVLSIMSPVARRRYEMTDRQHEAGSAGESITRLMPGEIIAILAFWAFLAALPAAGRLAEPRAAAVG